MTLRDSFRRYSDCFGCVLFAQGRVDVLVGAPTGATPASLILLINSSLFLEGGGAISMVPYTGSDYVGRPVTLVSDVGHKSEFATIQRGEGSWSVLWLWPRRGMGSFVRCELFVCIFPLRSHNIMLGLLFC
jgi:hypothetical protein